MGNKNYDELDLDGLRDAKLAIDAEIADLRAEKKAIAEVENRKVAEQQTAYILATLSDDQKRALAQFVTAQGFDASQQ